MPTRLVQHTSGHNKKNDNQQWFEICVMIEKVAHDQ